MGSWRNRPRFFHRRRTWKSPPPYSYDEEPPSFGYPEDGVPLWEKKFCTMIGSVPWQKVVNARKFMFCSNVLDWDDSAGKEAFDNAKSRFWAHINGLPCDTSPPDPDIYIDEIDWNPDIDPELMKELESVYFAPPDDGENDGLLWRKRKKTRNFRNANISSNFGERRNNMEASCAPLVKTQDLSQHNTSHNVSENKNKYDNPWASGGKEDDEKFKVQGWDQWDNKQYSKKLNNEYNPWERNIAQCKSPARESTWGNPRKRDSVENPWEQGCHGIDYARDGKGKGWGESGDNSWGWSQHKPWKLDSSENPWPHSDFTRYRGPPKYRGWRDSGGHSQGWKGRDNYNGKPRRVEYRSNSNEGGNRSKGCRKREGSHLTSYRISGYQPDYSETGHSWRSRNSNKRVDFAL